jgi:RNA polymerase sigma-70 factor (ECF subfamily)
MESLGTPYNPLTVSQPSDPDAKRPGNGNGDIDDIECGSTTQLLVRARTGDRSAVTVLLERAIPPLKRWTHGRIPSFGRGPADTEDIVQDAVVQTLRRIDTFEHRSVGALQAFLRQVVVNRIRDVVRRVRRRGVPEELPEELHDDEMSPLEQAIMTERTEHFVAALGLLRPTDRQLVIWRIELGYSYSDIAEQLGKSEPAARMAVTRAVERLGAKLRPASAAPLPPVAPRPRPARPRAPRGSRSA